MTLEQFINLAEKKLNNSNHNFGCVFYAPLCSESELSEFPLSEKTNEFLKACPNTIGWSKRHRRLYDAAGCQKHASAKVVKLNNEITLIVQEHDFDNPQHLSYLLEEADYRNWNTFVVSCALTGEWPAISWIEAAVNPQPSLVRRMIEKEMFTHPLKPHLSHTPLALGVMRSRGAYDLPHPKFEHISLYDDLLEENILNFIQNCSKARHNKSEIRVDFRINELRPLCAVYYPFENLMLLSNPELDAVSDYIGSTKIKGLFLKYAKENFNYALVESLPENFWKF